jgi:biopolymer transport protein ExbD
MSIATVSSGEPMGEINTTPLIDVMLVLLIMIIMTIPVSTHSLDFVLPQPDPDPKATRLIRPVKNSLVLTTEGQLLWNGGTVSDGQLARLLVNVRATRPEPEVHFEPEANTSYARSAEILRIVEASRVTRFGFVGNEKYRVFDREGRASEPGA